MFETPFVESKCINIIYGMAVLDIFFTEIYNDSWFQFKARNGYDLDCAINAKKIHIMFTLSHFINRASTWIQCVDFGGNINVETQNCQCEESEAKQNEQKNT